MDGWMGAEVSELTSQWSDCPIIIYMHLTFVDELASLFMRLKFDAISNIHWQYIRVRSPVQCCLSIRGIWFPQAPIPKQFWLYDCHQGCYSCYISRMRLEYVKSRQNTKTNFENLQSTAQCTICDYNFIGDYTSGQTLRKAPWSQWSAIWIPQRPDGHGPGSSQAVLIIWPQSSVCRTNLATFDNDDASACYDRIIVFLAMLAAATSSHATECSLDTCRSYSPFDALLCENCSWNLWRMLTRDSVWTPVWNRPRKAVHLQLLGLPSLWSF